METIPRRSLANSLATYRHPPVWSSPMCLMVWLPSQRSQPQESKQNNWLHLNIKAICVYVYIVYLFVYLSIDRSLSIYLLYVCVFTDIFTYVFSTIKYLFKEHPLNTVDMFVRTLWQNDKHMISSWWFGIQDMKCCFADLCVLFKGSICQPWRMGSDLGLHGILRGLPGTDPRKCCVCRGLWIQGADRFWPGWENQKAQCRNRQRKTCDDGHHRHVFPGGGRGLCGYCLLQLNQKRNTTKSVAERVQQCRASTEST